METILYAVVVFDETEEVEFVPLKWLVDKSLLADLPAAVKKRRSLKFYWPPWRNLSSLSRAQKLRVDPECSWPKYDARILSTAKNEEEARSKCIHAQETSNVEAVYEKRQGKRPARFDSDDSSSAAGDEIKVNDNDLAHKSTCKTKQKLKMTQSGKMRKRPSVSMSTSTKVIQKSYTVRSKPLPPECPPASIYIPEMDETGIDSSGASVEKTHAHPVDGTHRYKDDERESIQSAEPFVETHADIPNEHESIHLDTDADAILTVAENNTGSELGLHESDGRPVSATATSQTARKSALVPEGHGLIGNLLIRVLSNLEQMKQTQKQHSHMLQVLLQQQTGQTESVVPDGLTLPMVTSTDVDNNEEKLKESATRAAVMALLVEIGGNGLPEFIKRCMKYVMDSNLARQFNLTGQRGKRAFQDLLMFKVVYAAAKLNASTKDCNRKTIEGELQTWFGNARDRGYGGRRQRTSVNQPPLMDPENL